HRHSKHRRRKYRHPKPRHWKRRLPQHRAPKCHGLTHHPPTFRRPMRCLPSCRVRWPPCRPRSSLLSHRRRSPQRRWHHSRRLRRRCFRGRCPRCRRRFRFRPRLRPRHSPPCRRRGAARRRTRPGRSRAARLPRAASRRPHRPMHWPIRRPCRPISRPARLATARITALRRAVASSCSARQTRLPARRHTSRSSTRMRRRPARSRDSISSPREAVVSSCPSSASQSAKSASPCGLLRVLRGPEKCVALPIADRLRTGA
ncbi:pseudouridine synthase, partial [Burkholderia pseudomallei]